MYDSFKSNDIPSKPETRMKYFLDSKTEKTLHLKRIANIRLIFILHTLLWKRICNQVARL